MEFDKKRVYSATDADKVKLGSIGYFADSLGQLKTLVEYGKAGDMHSLTTVYSEDSAYRFSYGAMQWNLFYLIEERKEELCTHKELAYWLTKGNGERKFVHDDVASTYFHYDVENEDTPLKEATYEVRKWGDKKWHTPTREYMGFV